MCDANIELGQLLTAMPSQLTTYLNVESELGDLGQRYLGLLLAGNRHEASQLVTEAVKDGAPIKTVYIEVFQNSQYEIGRLWQRNEISVAQEHFCTAATQLIISQLYPYLFSHNKTGHRLVVACTGGDLHELGVRMVADFFEMEGWDTFYLGANTTADIVVQNVIEHQAHVLGVSATMTCHVQTVADLIAQVRRTPECAEVKILVGGYPFVVDRELWRQIGADAMANNADYSIATANQLV
jgi:methylmalonyl-CoA mutase cobalamin-binding domain/chain